METSSNVKRKGFAVEKSVFSKEIQVFVAVYESKSFASAAHQLNIDPAHVSRVVQRLEDFWNTRFFVSHSRGVEPPSSAHDLFAALDGAKKQLMMSNLARTQGSLKAKIGFSQSTGATHLARHVLPVLISAGFDLETSISTSQNLIQKIQNRELDLIVTAGKINHTDLVVTPLTSENAVFASLSGKDEDILFFNPELLGPNGPLRFLILAASCPKRCFPFSQS
jgi:DNA-binding transcriptional LysR family regulator